MKYNQFIIIILLGIMSCKKEIEIMPKSVSISKPINSCNNKDSICLITQKLWYLNFLYLCDNNFCYDMEESPRKTIMHFLQDSVIVTYFVKTNLDTVIDNSRSYKKWKFVADSIYLTNSNGFNKDSLINKFKVIKLSKDTLVFSLYFNEFSDEKYVFTH